MNHDMIFVIVMMIIIMDGDEALPDFQSKWRAIWLN